MKKFLYAICLLVFLGFLSSCNKEQSILEHSKATELVHQINFDDIEFIDDESDCFFTNDCLLNFANKKENNKSGLDPIVKKAKKYFKNKPNLKNRVKDRFGYPLWKNSKSFYTESGDLVLIPVVQDYHEQTEVILIAFKQKDKNSFKFKVLKRNKIDNFRKIENISELSKELSFEYVLTQLILFDYHIFGKVDCDLVQILKTKNNSKACEPWIIETTTYWDVYIGGVYAYSDQTVTYSYEWICNDGDLIADNNGGGSGSGGGTGGSGGSTNNTTTEDVTCPDGKKKDDNGNCVDVHLPGYLCLNNANFTVIGDGLYVVFTNLDYNFLHNNSGISVKANIRRLCFQFPAGMSDNTRYRKFKIALEVAVLSTEAYLTRYWNQNPAGALVPPLLDTEWKRFITAGIASQFGSSASVSSTCPGVYRTTPASWTCT